MRTPIRHNITEAGLAADKFINKTRDTLEGVSRKSYFRPLQINQLKLNLRRNRKKNHENEQTKKWLQNQKRKNEIKKNQGKQQNTQVKKIGRVSREKAIPGIIGELMNWSYAVQLCD